MIFEHDPFETPFDSPATKARYETYSIEAVLANVPRAPYDADALLKAVATHTYSVSARVGLETPSYQTDAIIVLDPADPRLDESFVNALMWSFANEWRKAARAIELLELRMKLDYAQTDDLDDYWGVVLGLRRKGLETDDDYRTRLAIRIAILTSSGTKANCQAIIDRITGTPGGSLFETFAPAHIVLSWTSPDAIVAAQAKSSMISDAMDAMIAAGVSWSTSYPLVTYDIDGHMIGYDTTDYQIGGAIGKLRGFVYHMTGGIWDSGSATYQADGALQVAGGVTYRTVSRIVQDAIKTYQLGGIVARGQDVTYLAAAYAQKPLVAGHQSDGIVAISGLGTYSSDGILQKTRHGNYQMGGILT